MMPYYPYAYITKNDEGSSVVFANDESHAYDLSDYAETVKRAPEFDEYWWLGRVPEKVLLAHNWYCKCPECDTLFNSEAWDYDEDKPLEPVEHGHDLFCSVDCLESFNERVQLGKIQNTQIKCFLRSKFPGITRLHIFGSTAFFRFPGGKHEVEWSADHPEIVKLWAMDVEAWSIFEKDRA